MISEDCNLGEQQPPPRVPPPRGQDFRSDQRFTALQLPTDHEQEVSQRDAILEFFFANSRTLRLWTVSRIRLGPVGSWL